MIDFTKDGTKLPKIKGDIKASVSNWDENCFETKNHFDFSNFVSYGVTNRHKIGPCILVEESKYTGNNFWEIPLETIQKLAKKQGMIKEKKIIGYKAPADIPSWRVIKDDIYKLNDNQTLFYKGSGNSMNLPKELVETWEPAYEETSKEFTIGKNNTKVLVKKNGIWVDKLSLDIDEISSLLNPKTSAIKRFGSSQYGVELLDATYKIGCGIFNLGEIREIINYYNSIK